MILFDAHHKHLTFFYSHALFRFHQRMEEGSPLGGINSAPEASSARNLRMRSPAELPEYSSTSGGFLGRLRAGWSSLMRGTIASSIFTLLTTCIGAGTLSLPYAFEQGGLIPASVIFFLIMVVSIVVGFQLFSAKKYCEQLRPGTEVWGYEDIALIAFGPVGKIVVLMTLIVLLLLSLIAYMIYTRDQLDLIVQFALTKAGHIPTCSPLVNCAVLMSIAFIPLFPITLLRDLTPMQITSTFSIICITYVGITMFIRMIMYQSDGHHDNSQLSVFPRRPQGLLVTVTYCSLSFVCHFNLLPLQRELHRPTKRRMSIIVVGSMLLAYTLYNLVIFSGLFRFFGELKDDVMLNYPRTDVLMTTARIALFFTLLCSYPVLLHPTRAAINRLIIYGYQIVLGWVRGSRGRVGSGEVVNRKDWEGEGEMGNGETEEKKPLLKKTAKNSTDVKIPLPVWISETWILFTITFICASYIPNVGLVWNFVGSIGGTLVLYIFPPAFFLRLRYMRYKQRQKCEGVSVPQRYNWSGVVRDTVATVIMVTGMLLLIAENYSAIDNVLTQPDQPSGLCYQSKCASANVSSFANITSDYHSNNNWFWREP